MLLGDPGIGKSTFLNYVAWLLSRPAENALIDRMGWRLPLPMVLRELPVRGVTDFDGLLEAFLGREMSAPLREDDGRYLRQALADGQAFVLLDGIDELGDREARENLRSAVFDGMDRYPDCRWLLTSRIVGYDEVPFDSAHSRRDEPPFPDEPDGEAARHDSAPEAPRAPFRPESPRASSHETGIQEVDRSLSATSPRSTTGGSRRSPGTGTSGVKRRLAVPAPTPTIWCERCTRTSRFCDSHAFPTS